MRSAIPFYLSLQTGRASLLQSRKTGRCPRHCYHSHTHVCEQGRLRQDATGGQGCSSKYYYVGFAHMATAEIAVKAMKCKTPDDGDFLGMPCKTRYFWQWLSCCPRGPRGGWYTVSRKLRHELFLAYSQRARGRGVTSSISERRLLCRGHLKLLPYARYGSTTRKGVPVT